MNSEKGYLTVGVSTANGAIPLANATVTVYDENYSTEQTGNVCTAVKTDISGKTVKIPLDAPDRSLSENPGNKKPYSTYTVTVTLAGYYPVTNGEVPVFSGITSLLQVEMLALAEYDSQNVYPREGLDFGGEQEPSL